MNVIQAHYLALDPGDSTGWAQFDEDGTSVTFDTLYGKEALFTFLDLAQPTFIIMEDYKLFPWKAQNQSWSRLDTVRTIGAVEHWLWLKFGEAWQQHLEYQDPKVKSIAYMWAGIPKPKAKSESHYADAYVHGVYYLQKNGIRRPQQGRG